MMSRVAAGGVPCVVGARLVLNSVLTVKVRAQLLNNCFNTRTPNTLILAIDTVTFQHGLLQSQPLSEPSAVGKGVNDPQHILKVKTDPRLTRGTGVQVLINNTQGADLAVQVVY